MLRGLNNYSEMIKDYYYVLGLSRTASVIEVKNAYRKLSLKFHPDKNDGDEFFMQRFQDIQEAYEVLLDTSRRKIFDALLDQQDSAKKYQSFTPVVEYFTINKTSVAYGEIVEFRWRCLNCTKVLIEPFGEVNHNGSKSFKIKNFDKQKLEFKIVAFNEAINKEASKYLSITNSTYLRLRSKIIEEYLAEVKKSEQDKRERDIGTQAVTRKNKRKIIPQGGGKVIGVMTDDANIIEVGAMVFEGSYPAKDGNYRMGWFSKIVVRDGKVLKII